ncbi:hypothetical protein H2200_001379 [Cladophialophora chaetospira]|uniref:Clr5 domain-containing protein n=1 Tax=Cladophialophora chaetospira TaxID=386627 RepID=A0AA38XKS8_9EURO|nr:hypothetical protein H2200_001379 [Cladophialophora chaetospira]
MGTKRPSGGSWASAAEWERYQSTITDMYIDQNLTLNAVIGKMKTEHGFYATKTMYKRRFEKWGAEKYLKALMFSRFSV